jgi:hypothetical protein
MAQYEDACPRPCKVERVQCAVRGRGKRGERDAHVGDEVVEGLLLFAELNHDGQDVVVKSHSRDLANLLDVVRMHNITARARHHVCVSTHRRKQRLKTQQVLMCESR